MSSFEHEKQKELFSFLSGICHLKHKHMDTFVMLKALWRLVKLVTSAACTWVQTTDGHFRQTADRRMMKLFPVDLLCMPHE